MNGMTFETFRVDAGNRAAYDYCRRAAMLQYVPGRPVVLLGPEAAGKSHLLWAIVQHLRVSNARAGLALVMASEFPEQVRHLALNPSPIQDGKPALLLVDELEAFDTDAYALEGVVKAFLANGQGVILSSAIHPDRLMNFSESFRSLLCRGDIFELQPVSGAVPATLAEEPALVEALRAERDALEAKLAEKANESAEMANVKARLDEAMRHVEQLTLALADTSRMDAIHDRHQAELAAVAAERDGYRQAVDALRDERDGLERKLAERVGLAVEPTVDPRTAEEVVALRTQLAQAEESAARANETQGSLIERINHLQAEMAEYRGGLEEARDLRRQLEEAHAAANLERAERDIAIRAAADLEKFFDTERGKADAAVAELRAQVNALVADAMSRGPVDTREQERLQSELTRMETELADARSLAAAFRMQMDQDREAFEVEALQLRGDHAQFREISERALAEQGRLATANESMKSALRTAEYELDKERKHNQFLTSEMDALRSEAATQVAQANMQAGEMEARMLRLGEALDLALQRGKSAAAHAEALSSAFAQASAALIAAREDLALIEIPPYDPTQEEGEGNGHSQGTLFDASAFIREFASLPDSFESPMPESAPEPAPAPELAPTLTQRPLHELVEEVLAGEGPAQS